MRLFDKNKGEFVDVVKCAEGTSGLLISRFDNYEREIEYGARLEVGEGQVAVLVNSEQIADIFQTGEYELKTENLPLLSALQGWKYGFNGPFRADIIFVGIKKIEDLIWSAASPLDFTCPELGELKLRARGRYAVKVNNPSRFVKENVYAGGKRAMNEIVAGLNGLIIGELQSVLESSGMTGRELENNAGELSSLALEKLLPVFMDKGLELISLEFLKIALPEMDGPPAENGKSSDEKQVQEAIDANFVAESGPVESPPPPPSSSLYYLAEKGKQKGPFNIFELEKMAGRGELNGGMYAWKSGMEDWSPVSGIGELKDLLKKVTGPDNSPPEK